MPLFHTTVSTFSNTPYIIYHCPSFYVHNAPLSLFHATVAIFHLAICFITCHCPSFMPLWLCSFPPQHTTVRLSCRYMYAPFHHMYRLWLGWQRAVTTATTFTSLRWRSSISERQRRRRQEQRHRYSERRSWPRRNCGVPSKTLPLQWHICSGVRVSFRTGVDC